MDYDDDFVSDAKCGTCGGTLENLEQYIQGFCSWRCRDIALDKLIERHEKTAGDEA